MAGDDIACPSCGTVMRVPEAPAAETVVEEPISTPSSGAPRQKIQLNAAANTAAGDALIQKPIKPLEAAAKAAIRMYVKTFRHGDYLAGGKNGFDETVSKFLQDVGEPHLMSIHPIHYSRMDSESKQVMEDYGVVIVYRREG